VNLTIIFATRRPRYARRPDGPSRRSDPTGRFNHCKSLEELKRCLCGADHRLADTVTLGDAHLLRQEDLLGRNLDTEVTACYHYPIGRFQYLVEPATAVAGFSEVRHRNSHAETKTGTKTDIENRPLADDVSPHTRGYSSGNGVHA